jgi:hypothetical protein
LADGALDDLATLQQIPLWLVVSRAVVVHATRRDVAATGLFGLLGDEVIRIIDHTEVGNHADILALYALAEEKERNTVAVYRRQNFNVPAVEELQKEMQNVAMRCFRDEAVFPHLRPAIMFRLCDQACNHK